MRCQCGWLNREDESRCARCGRRLQQGAEPAAVLTYPAPTSSAVPAAECNAAAPSERPAEPRSKRGRPHQPSLFAGDHPKVIPFESIAALPARGPSEAAPRRTAAPKAPRKEQPAPAASLVQSALDFLPVSPAPRQQPVTVRHAPVAPIRVRSAAAALDALITAAGLGFFLLAFHMMGGALVLNHKSVPGYLAVAAAMAMFYRLFWCVLRTETPGMRCFHLRILNFDGYPADGRERLIRFAAAVLGTLSGLGLLWAVCDAETLTWHDHISKTIPVVVKSRNLPFRR